MAHTAIRGFVLTIAGCPYVFTTGGLAAVTSSDALWFGAETGVQIADGWLFWPDITIRESARPLDGDVDVDPIRLKLHDQTITTGPAAGNALSTWLFTQDANSIPSSLLATAATSAATSLTVGDGTPFSADTFAWTEQECVRVTAKVGNVLTVTRGRLGTKAVSHRVDLAEGLQPELFARLPWSVRRKVVLWAVDSGLVARPFWVGATGHAPDLSGDGLTFELPCDPLWNIVKESTVGAAKGTVELVGVNTQAVGPLRGAATLANPAQAATFSAPPAQYADFESAAQALIDAGLVSIDALSAVTNGTTRGAFRRDGGRGQFLFDFVVSVGASVNAGGSSMGGPGAPGGSPWISFANYPANVQDQGSNRWTLQYEMEYCPTVAYTFLTDGTLNTFGIRNALPVDVVSLVSSGAPSGRAFQIRTGLRAELSEDWWAMFTDITTDPTTRTFTARAGVHPRKGGAVRPFLSQSGVLIDPRPLQVVLSVQAEHWADGFRYGILPQLDSTVSADWDWSLYDRLIFTTRGPQAVRHWTIDGDKSVNKLLSEVCLLNGCSVGTRHGKLALIPWELPRSGATPVASFTSSDLVGTATPWQIWREGFANSATLKSDLVSINIEDSRSVRRYGKGRSLTVDMEGVEAERLRSLQPGELQRQMLSRLALWADPVSVVQVQTSLTRMFDVFMGDLIEVTDWCAPNGVGGRGLNSEAGIVLGRTLNIQAGTLTLETLLFRRFAHGYAPCVKARAVTAVSSTIVQLDPLPVRGTEDYAGSVAATLSDAGSSKFTSGARVLAIQRDTESVFTEQLTLASAPTFDGVYYRFTFTTAMSVALQNLLTAGAWVDFTLDQYSTATEAERHYAWIGDDTTLTIGGTTDPPHRIAP